MRVIGSEDPKRYEEILRDASEQKQEVLIANRFPWQTRMATKSLLDHARNSHEPVSILAGTGGQNFFDDEMARSLRNCADAGCEIRMLVWQPDESTIAPAVKELRGQGKITLRLSGTKKFSTTLPHFLLVGEDAYRQEAGHPEFPPDMKFDDTSPDIPARISFNDPMDGLRLKGMFETFWQAAGQA